ncbi:HPr(Ser) kinase/phosphatase [Gaopeijia maritima]|uniref:HPr kinase/phosphorylase n=1 Tax=Gaopeijia maritima TaxID=3119007 RepID=A0ABU9ECD5_9BACT
MTLRSSDAPVTPLTVSDLFATKRESLELEVLTPEVPLDGVIANPDISSPGLALSGFTQRFVAGRPQVLGETEMTYLATLGAVELRLRLATLLSFEIPVLFVTKGLAVPSVLTELATEAEVPVIRSRVTTKDFFFRIKPFLESALAPTTHLHGSLADVYGVGLLFIGKSGVGKSECVLDLVERGHRLVADDLVLASRRGSDVLIGRGHPLQRHHMEIRGVGIIDIQKLFGVRAIRQQKRIEVIVQLEHWDETHNYTRTGLDQETTEVLGVELPQVTVPLNPGKNITVISEVVAMNHLLRFSGVDSAKAFDQHLRSYLEQDFE